MLLGASLHHRAYSLSRFFFCPQWFRLVLVSPLFCSGCKICVKTQHFTLVCPLGLARSFSLRCCIRIQRERKICVKAQHFSHSFSSISLLSCATGSVLRHSTGFTFLHSGSALCLVALCVKTQRCLFSYELCLVTL